MDREAWRAAVHGVAKSWTQLSDWTELSLLPAHLLQYLTHPNNWNNQKLAPPKNFQKYFNFHQLKNTLSLEDSAHQE